MKSSKWLAAVLVAGLVAGPAHALDTHALLGAGPAKQLLEGKQSICAETTGEVPVPFDQALAVFAQSNLLVNIQKEYCELLTENGTPEFTINQTSTNTYFYINKEGERTDIVDLLRRPADDGAFDIVFYATGKRFFGSYQALIHVRLRDNGAGGTDYDAVVHAYPENAFSRFFARHFGLVERYFAKKTGQMTEIITTIGCSLCAKMS